MRQERKQSLDQQLDPLTFSKINEQAWHQALLMTFSEIPTSDNYEEGCSSYANPCDEFMDATGDWPEGFTVWQPFENWPLEAVQETVGDFHDSLLVFLVTALKTIKVINNE